MLAEKKIIIVRMTKKSFDERSIKLLSNILLQKVYTYFIQQENDKKDAIPYTIFLDEGQLHEGKILTKLLDISHKKNMQIVSAHNNSKEVEISNRYDTQLLFRQNIWNIKPYEEKIYNDDIQKARIALEERGYLLYSAQKKDFKICKLPFYDFTPKNLGEKKDIIKTIYALQFGVTSKWIDLRITHMIYV